MNGHFEAAIVLVKAGGMYSLGISTKLVPQKFLRGHFFSIFFSEVKMGTW